MSIKNKQVSIGTQQNTAAAAAGVEDWVLAGPEGEQRLEASRRISAFMRDSSARILDLSGLGLTSLPTEIGKLTNLAHLNLGNNQLTSLPPEIGQLTRLERLWLSNNQLTSLPKEIGNLTNLTVLVLANNQLTSLPEEIGQLTNLTLLSLNDNQLTSLPKEIRNLTNLKWFNFVKNQLTSLPKEIGNLTNLTVLVLANNYLPETEISKLPENIIAVIVHGVTQKNQEEWQKDYDACVAKIMSITDEIQSTETHNVQEAFGIYFNGVDLPNEVEYHIIAQLKDKREAVRLTCKSARDYSNFLELEALNDQQRELMRVKNHLDEIAKNKSWESSE